MVGFVLVFVVGNFVTVIVSESCARFRGIAPIKINQLHLALNVETLTRNLNREHFRNTRTTPSSVFWLCHGVLFRLSGSRHRRSWPKQRADSVMNTSNMPRSVLQVANVFMSSWQKCFDSFSFYCLYCTICTGYVILVFA